MKNIVLFSGGKDSTAMLLKMLELDYQIDEIVMFDTGWEFPQMYEHIKKVKQYTGMPVTVLQDDKGFDYWHGEHVKTKGKNIGKVGYGWPDFRNRWCTAKKRDIQSAYLNKKYGAGNYLEYQGIAYDEAHRLEKNKGRNIVHPMMSWQMAEAQALQYCYDKGFTWEGLYEKFDRVSCYCCPLQRIGELEVIYNEFPELWKKMLEMDERSFRAFRSDYTLKELEAKFQKKAA